MRCRPISLTTALEPASWKTEDNFLRLRFQIRSELSYLTFLVAGCRAFQNSPLGPFPLLAAWNQNSTGGEICEATPGSGLSS